MRFLDCAHALFPYTRLRFRLNFKHLVSLSQIRQYVCLKEALRTCQTVLHRLHIVSKHKPVVNKQKKQFNNMPHYLISVIGSFSYISCHFLLFNSFCVMRQFSCFFCRLLSVFKINFFRKFFTDHFQIVQQLGSKSRPTFCRS